MGRRLGVSVPADSEGHPTLSLAAGSLLRLTGPAGSTASGSLFLARSWRLGSLCPPGWQGFYRSGCLSEPCCHPGCLSECLLTQIFLEALHVRNCPWNWCDISSGSPLVCGQAGCCVPLRRRWARDRFTGEEGEKRGKRRGSWWEGGGSGAGMLSGPSACRKSCGPGSVRIEGESWPPAASRPLGLWNALFIYGSVEA